MNELDGFGFGFESLMNELIITYSFIYDPIKILCRWWMDP